MVSLLTLVISCLLVIVIFLPDKVFLLLIPNSLFVSSLWVFISIVLIELTVLDLGQTVEFCPYIIVFSGRYVLGGILEVSFRRPLFFGGDLNLNSSDLVNWDSFFAFLCFVLF